MLESVFQVHVDRQTRGRAALGDLGGLFGQGLLASAGGRNQKHGPAFAAASVRFYANLFNYRSDHRVGIVVDVRDFLAFASETLLI